MLTVDNAIKEEKPEELSPEIVRSKTNQIEKQLLMQDDEKEVSSIKYE